MILCAGEGTRLLPLTLATPKPMLPIAGRPMLEYTLAWLKYHSITQIAINLYHCPRVVMQHFADGSAFGVNITYSLEDRLLGTAGGVKNISRFFDGAFIVVYGDVLTDLDLESFIEYHLTVCRNQTHLSMMLYRVPNPCECGVACVDEDGRVNYFVEKPAQQDVCTDLVSSGVLMLDREILQFIPEGRPYDFGKDLFPRLLQEGVPVYGRLLPDDSYLLDIGTPEKFAQAQRDWPTPKAYRFIKRHR